MNKIIMALAVAGIFTVAVPTNATASEPSNSSAISARAIKDFQKTYKGITDAVWNKSFDGGYVARFNSSSVKTTVAYNSRGVWQYTTLAYNEKELPKDVRAIIKSTYYDYAIAGVVEVHFEDHIVYIAYAQDEKNFKVIRVSDGEMQEVKSYQRG